MFLFFTGIPVDSFFLSISVPERFSERGKIILLGNLNDGMFPSGFFRGKDQKMAFQRIFCSGKNLRRIILGESTHKLIHQILIAATMSAENGSVAGIGFDNGCFFGKKIKNPDF